MQIIHKTTGEVLATITANHSMTLDEAVSLASLKIMQEGEKDGYEYEDLELVTSLDDYKKDLFGSMVDDFMADHPEYSDLMIGEAEKDESGNWVAYAEDDRSTYILHDCGGNILLDYIGTK